MPSISVTLVGVQEALTPSVAITGGRHGKRITITGVAVNLAGETLHPWIRFPRETTYRELDDNIRVTAGGTLTWSRKIIRRAHVYVAVRGTRSNIVVIPAR